MMHSELFHFCALTPGSKIVITVVSLVALSVYIVYYYMTNKVNQQQEISSLQQDFERSILTARIEMQEQTFREISKDIHDNIGQQLTLAKVMLWDARRKQTPPAVDIENIISGVMTELRDLSKSMRADLVIKEGIVAAIKKDVDYLVKAEKIKASFELIGDDILFDDCAELLLYRIFQEALQNIIRHSGASEIDIKMLFSAAEFQLTVTDNGIGYKEMISPGQGVSNMEARTRSLGGVFKIKGVSGGTELNLNVPPGKGEQGRHALNNKCAASASERDFKINSFSPKHTNMFKKFDSTATITSNKSVALTALEFQKALQTIGRFKKREEPAEGTVILSGYSYFGLQRIPMLIKLTGAGAADTTVDISAASDDRAGEAAQECIRRLIDSYENPSANPQRSSAPNRFETITGMSRRKLFTLIIGFTVGISVFVFLLMLLVKRMSG